MYNTDIGVCIFIHMFVTAKNEAKRKFAKPKEAKNVFLYASKRKHFSFIFARNGSRFPWKRKKFLSETGAPYI
jgi:hypothetical protein